MIKFTVPGEPCAQGRPQFVKKTGIAFDPKKSKNYKAFVMGIAADNCPEKPLDSYLEVRIIAYFSIPKSKSAKWKGMAVSEQIMPDKKPDLDNIAKIICDSCNGIIYADDKQITDLAIKKRYSDKPRVEVEIKVVG